MPLIKHGAASTVDGEGREQLDAVRDFLAGGTSEVDVCSETDRAMRQAIAAELLAAMTWDLPNESLNQLPVTSPRTPEEASSTASGLLAGDQQQPNYGNQEKQERARKLFMDHGYFDEAVQDLRSA
ncbi:MAG TPA: hypothetical protein VMS31_04865, partial [Pyrinomonadaceae bacterium]|nr:hypothetical protein [Pyrinomonadaceae bacterium]